MILTCSDCSARYVVDPAALGPDGRTVRCARCGHEWHAAPTRATEAEFFTPPTPEPEKVQATVWDDPEPEAEAEPKRKRKRKARGANLPAVHGERRRGGPAWAAAALLLGVLGAGGYGLWAWRAELVDAWEPVARLYAAVGQPVAVPGEGLDLPSSTIKATPVEVDGVTLLQIEGQVHNVSGTERDVPPLHIGFLGADGQEIRGLTVTPEPRRLRTGDIATFSLRHAPVEGAVELKVRFAP